MKVLYISNYRDKTFLSSVALDNIRSLQAVGVDVVCRPVSFVDTKGDIGSNIDFSDIDCLENKSLDSVDAVIQHIPPNFYEYKKGVKNIGFLYWYQSSIYSSAMKQCCNMMDEIWTPCDDAAQSLKTTGINVPVFTTKHGRDSLKFDLVYTPLDIKPLKHRLVYYTITNLTRRQNVSGLIRSYYAAFNKHHDVHLLICLPVSTKQEEQETNNRIEAVIKDIKKASNICASANDYPKISILCGDFDKQQIGHIHATGNVFVSCDRGEPWNVFLHDALGFGKTVVCSCTGGQRELMGRHGNLIRGQQTPCLIVSDGTDDQLDTGKHFWFDPDLKEFADAMFGLYTEWENKSLTMFSRRSQDIALEHDYHKIGMVMKERLERSC